MKWRWLLGNFSDPQYKLSASEQFDVSMVAHKRYMPSGRLWGWSIFALALPALLLMKFALPLALSALGYAGQNTAWLIGAVVIVLFVWVMSAWVYGHLYVEPVRKAMRDRGLDLCLSCGYLLNELPEDVERCPECGHRRPPDRLEPES